MYVDYNISAKGTILMRLLMMLVYNVYITNRLIAVRITSISHFILLMQIWCYYNEMVLTLFLLFNLKVLKAKGVGDFQSYKAYRKEVKKFTPFGVFCFRMAMKMTPPEMLIGDSMMPSTIPQNDSGVHNIRTSTSIGHVIHTRSTSLTSPTNSHASSEANSGNEEECELRESELIDSGSKKRLDPRRRCRICCQTKVAHKRRTG